jgi:iron complex transport system ATP-binding protein
MDANRALAIQNLTAGYDAAVLVLRDFSLRTAAGEITAIIGPNGCGKSTLLRVVAGLLGPQAGDLRLGEHDLLRLPPRERARLIALLPQQFEVREAMTVEELVLLGRTPHLSAYGSPSAHDYELVREAMERTITSALAQRRIGELSGGERQRVLLARAIAQQPKVLLLDEPTSNLDLRFQFEILQLVHQLARREAMIVVVVLHQINLAAALADSMILLESGGATRASGSPQEVITKENLEAVYGVPLRVTDDSPSRRPQAYSDWTFGD